MNGYTDKEAVGSLLKGGTLLFGKRVELAWPDGLPAGMDEDALRRVGEQWAPQEDWPQWVPAGTRFCPVRVPCGHVLADGECVWHGRQP